MNKQAYLRELESEMIVAGMTDIPEHLAYFEELFNDMLEDGLSEDEVTARLGSPRQLVRTLLQEEKGESAPENSPKEAAEGSIPSGEGTKTSFAAFGDRLLKTLTEYLNRSGASTADYATEISEEGLHSLDIAWELGDIAIRAENRQGILLKESRRADAAPLEYQCKNGLLLVRARIETVYLGRGKDLEVILPLTLAQRLETCRVRTVSGDASTEKICCGMLQIKSVSGDLETDRVQAKDAVFSSTSGDIELDLSAERLSISTVSGDIRFQGTAAQLNLQTKSGDANLALESCPERVEAQTVSGDLELALPAGRPIRLSTRTVSGDVRVRGIGQDASARPLISARSVTGDILIRAK